ncbi:MAG: DUF5333 domain-containing protein [Defluviimonas sp.]|uniref:DUF5333 domain-containing protein n=1 Tax=Albidovulum sp. TaxID=1872424 RepID=UPI002A296766|nr:DUF5333 domain-containing protein [Defluviimonas sp.]
MKRISRLTLPVALAGLVATGAAATALEPLGQNSYVTDRLVAARVADRIRKTCPDLGGRVFYAFQQAYDLKRWVRAQGYSEDAIDGYLDDKDEKHKIYAMAERYLAANGAKKDDVAGFCALGRKEIAANSIAGSLLYEK